MIEVLRTQSLLRGVLLPLLCSFCVGVLGPLAITIPGLPVPFVVQSLVMLITANFLGTQGAFLMGSFFLLEGVLGFPFFSHGRSGVAMLIGPSGGYLWGCVLASGVSAFFTERKYIRCFPHFFSLLAGFFVIHLCGLLHLTCLFGLERAIFYGIFPFLGFDLMKIVIGASFLQKTQKRRSRL